MIKKIVQYTCVFACLSPVSPCFGDSAPVPAAVPVNAGSVSKPAIASAEVGDFAQQTRSILEKARDTNDEIYKNLHSFVCSEDIQRFKGSLKDETGKQIDTVTATVSFENGTERYSGIRQNAKSRPSMSSIAGAWSEGEFGTLLQQAQTLLSTDKPVFERYADLNGIATAIYEMEVGRNDSPWDLEVKSEHFRIPFRSRIWVSQTSGEILKIERISTSIPFRVGISEIRWSVQLKQTTINGKDWVLPETGEYAVTYQGSGHREWNVMRFSNYRRYSAEVAFRFQ